ncbi:MAG: hypothetical protein AAFV33_14255 [Chloroflexota bacterium]
MIKPEGRIRIAGEHCSFAHGWILGAFESALRESVFICAEANQLAGQDEHPGLAFIAKR